MSLTQQRDILEHTYRLLTNFNRGVPPRGIVAPWWEVSKEGTELLLEYGIEYDHSMSHHDCQAYYLRAGDEWTPIDYGKEAKEWMKPLVRGRETGLVEVPGSWYIDDLPVRQEFLSTFLLVMRGLVAASLSSTRCLVSFEAWCETGLK